MKKIKKVLVGAMTILPLCVLASCNKPSEELEAGIAYMDSAEEISLIKSIATTYDETNNTKYMSIQRLALTHPSGYHSTAIKLPSVNVAGYRQLDEDGLITDTAEFFNLNSGEKIATVEDFYNCSIPNSIAPIFSIIEAKDTVTQEVTTRKYLHRYFSTRGEELYKIETSSSSTGASVYVSPSGNVHEIGFAASNSDTDVKVWYSSIDETGNWTFLETKPKEKAKLPSGVSFDGVFSNQLDSTANESHYYVQSDSSIKIYDIEAGNLKFFDISKYLNEYTNPYISAIINNKAIFFLKTIVPHKVVDTIDPEAYDAVIEDVYYNYSVLSMDLATDEVNYMDTSYLVEGVNTVDTNSDEVDDTLFVNAKVPTASKTLGESKNIYSFNLETYSLDKKLTYIQDLSTLDSVKLITDATNTEYAKLSNALLNLSTKEFLIPTTNQYKIIGGKYYYQFGNESFSAFYLTNDYSNLKDLSSTLKIEGNLGGCGYKNNYYFETVEGIDFKIQMISNNQLSSRTIQFDTIKEFYSQVGIFIVEDSAEDESITYSIHDISGEKLGSGYTSYSSLDNVYTGLNVLTCYNNKTNAVEVFVITGQIGPDIQ